MTAVSLSEQNYRFLEEQSAPSAGRDVAVTLNDLLDRWREDFSEIRRVVAERVAAVDAGEYVDYDQESLRAFFGELDQLADLTAAEQPRS